MCLFVSLCLLSLCVYLCLSVCLCVCLCLLSLCVSLCVSLFAVSMCVCRVFFWMLVVSDSECCSCPNFNTHTHRLLEAGSSCEHVADSTKTLRVQGNPDVSYIVFLAWSVRLSCVCLVSLWVDLYVSRCVCVCVRCRYWWAQVLSFRGWLYVRLSVNIYNTLADFAVLRDALLDARRVFVRCKLWLVQ